MVYVDKSFLLVFVLCVGWFVIVSVKNSTFSTQHIKIVKRKKIWKLLLTIWCFRIFFFFIFFLLLCHFCHRRDLLKSGSIHWYQLVTYPFNLICELNDTSRLKKMLDVCVYNSTWPLMVHYVLSSLRHRTQVLSNYIQKIEDFFTWETRHI